MARWKDIPRQTLLAVVGGVCFGLVVLDYAIIEPMIHAWSEQSDRLATLRRKVDSGRKLLEREKIIRDRWAEMQRANLPDDDSAAMGEAINAMARWKLSSGIGLPSLTPPQQPREDNGYDDFEFRATVTGTETSIGQFLYALETDPIPVNLQECEIATRDAKGEALTLTARFSFARLTADTGNNNGGNNNGRNPR